MRHQKLNNQSSSPTRPMLEQKTTSNSEKENLQKDSKIRSIDEDLNDMKKELHLPQDFRVKYLGHRDATGLWGIKHTRKPVDEMVSAAKNSKGKILPLLGLHVSENGVTLNDILQSTSKELNTYYPLEVISYGVQDLMFTRVFAMIVVREEAKTNPSIHPFQCHAFVCDSRNNARKLTFALAEAFQIFSKMMKNKSIQTKKFAIDLRDAEELENDLRLEDSEA